MKKTLAILMISLLCLSALVGYAGTEALQQQTDSMMVSTLSKGLDRKLDVGAVDWSVMGTPHISYRDVETDGGNVAALRIDLSSIDLVSGRITPESIVIDGGQVEIGLLQQLMSLGEDRIGRTSIKAKAITLLDDEGKSLGVFDVDVTSLGEGGGLRVDIRKGDKQRMSLHVEKRERWYASIKGDHWCFFSSQKPFCIDDFTAAGRFDGKLLEIRDLKGKALGGKLLGDVDLKHEANWGVSGKANLNGVSARRFLRLLSSSGVSGTLSTSLTFKARMDKMGAPIRNVGFAGSFVVHDGLIGKASLHKAASLKKSSKGHTPFSRITGYLRYRANSVQLSDLHLTSNSVDARGDLSINNRQLDGDLVVGLRGANMLFSVPMTVRGSTSDPQLAVNSSVVAGATAGSILLGPGAGTMLGAKIGALLGKGSSAASHRRKKAKREAAFIN